MTNGQTAIIAALTATVAALTATVAKVSAYPNCVDAEEVFYVQRGDTVFWVPPHGSPARDSIVKLEGLPDTDTSVAPPIVRVCMVAKQPNRPVWKD